MLINLTTGELTFSDWSTDWSDLALHAEWLEHSVWQWVDVFAPEMGAL